MPQRYPDQAIGAAKRSRRRAKQHDERLRRDRRGLERELRERAELEAGPRDDPDLLPRIN